MWFISLKSYKRDWNICYRKFCYLNIFQCYGFTRDFSVNANKSSLNNYIIVMESENSLVSGVKGGKLYIILKNFSWGISLHQKMNSLCLHPMSLYIFCFIPRWVCMSKLIFFTIYRDFSSFIIVLSFLMFSVSPWCSSK